MSFLTGLNQVPPPGDCEHYIPREKRTCENPANWTAVYSGIGSRRGVRETKKLCQLHALRYRKAFGATITRILPIGEMVVEPTPEQPHCPQCGAATKIPVVSASGRPICPFCGA
jgi:hypothetical protein